MRRGYHTPACTGILSALVIACTDAALGPVNERTESRAPAAQANDIARGIALALGSPQLRMAVRDAMRASPLNEHKLVLQEFLDTPEGRQLVAAAAPALAVTEQRFVQMVKGLQELDFYAPFAKHRREWRATSDILVATTFNPDDRFLGAFQLDGSQVRLDYEQGTPSAPLLILHPAETKLRRLAIQRSARGETIQDPDEDERRVIAGTKLKSVGFNPDSSYIDFWNFHQGDGWFGDSELRFVSFYLDSWTGQTHEGIYRHGNVEEDEGYDVTAPLNRGHPRAGGDRLRIELWEDDPAGEYSDEPLGDDYYGEVTYTSVDRGVMKHFYHRDMYGILRSEDIVIDWFDSNWNRIPSHVTIGPSQPTVPAGGTLQLSYSVADQAGTAMTPSQHAAPTWQSMNPAVATVSSSGLVTGGSSEGSTTIRITVCPTTSPGSPCKESSVLVAVQVPIASVRITPNPVSLTAGEWTYVSATAYNASNQPIPGITFSWQTDNPAVATTTGTTVSGVAPGTTTIRATARGVTGTAPVYVAPPPSISVSIQGVGEMPTYYTCRWWTYVANGTPPYTYRWWVSGVEVSQSDQLTWSSGSEGFDIRVDVTDANGYTASDARYISVYPQAGPCVDQ